MERKIVEIFEYNGEWYQCVNQNGCCNCAFYNTPCHLMDELSCDSLNKKRKEKYIFKKLEKVGESFYSKYLGNSYQRYKTYIPAVGSNFKIRVTPVEYVGRNEIFIEIKEDMEEKDIKPYDKIFSEGTVSNTENLVTSSLKPFDLEAAKAGKPVCTRDGRKARIICFDAKRKDKKSIIALVPSRDYPGFEDLIAYPNNGNYHGWHENDGDLMMLPEKKEGWINIYNADTTFYYVDGRVFETKDKAVQEAKEEVEKEQREKNEYIDTIRVEWEE